MKTWTPWLAVTLTVGVGLWTVSRAQEMPGMPGMEGMHHDMSGHHPEAAALKNPVKPTAASIAKGKAVFAKNCVTCHGEKGNGDTPTGKALNPPAENLTDPAFQKDHADGQIFTSITKGITGSGMVSWEKSISEKNRWNLVNYIRTLAPKAEGKKTEAGIQKAKFVYVCPMDGEVISDQPGKCPKCGMALVQKET